MRETVESILTHWNFNLLPSEIDRILAAHARELEIAKLKAKMAAWEEAEGLAIEWGHDLTMLRTQFEKAYTNLRNANYI